jgi:hypothetical protein
MKKVLMGMVVAFAAITLIPVANAAPGDQRRLQDFHDYMTNHGYPDGGGRTGVQDYEYQGFQTCDALKQGASEGSQIGRLEGILSRAEASLVVAGAHQYLCPGV